MEILVGIFTIPYYMYFGQFYKIIFYYLGISIYILLVIFHLLTSLINPGLPPKKYFLENFKMDQSDMQNYIICKQCKLVMDLNKGTEHCIDCNICVMGNDHHCQWTSKCVGKNNLMFFNIFLILLKTHFIYLFFSFLVICYIKFTK